ncbi:MAG: hypothetical protein ACOYNL_09975 [Rickettsiales bacterium]
MTEERPIRPLLEPCMDAKKGKSKGEKLFDRAVYGGLAGVGTFALTLYVSFKLNHGNWAGGRYAKAVDWVEKKCAGMFSPSVSRKVAEQSVMTSSLMMGGNVMLAPIAAAEHYKVPIVRGLNSMVGDQTPPEQVELSPKQTLSSLIEGRLLAWGAVFTALFSANMAFDETFKTFKAEVGKHTHAVTQWFKREPKLVNMKTTRSFKVGELAALDVFATAAAATLLYVGGHFFARKQEEKKERRAEHPHSHRLPLGLEEAPDKTTAATGAAHAITGAKVHEGMLVTPVREAQVT